MQNRYTGDVGDFGKYALLNALAGEDIRLGVHWYLNGDEEANNDGRFTDYPKLRHFDPLLYDALHTIVNTADRRVSAIEQAGILPHGTLFCSTPLTFRDLPSWNSTLRASRRGSGTRMH